VGPHLINQAAEREAPALAIRLEGRDCRQSALLPDPLGETIDAIGPYNRARIAYPPM